jgi:hypothetical protein
MRWIALVLLLAVLLAAAACGEEDATGSEKPTSTQARDATAPAPVATVGFYQLTTAQPISEELARRLRSLAPTEDQVGAAFPDLAPLKLALLGDLGQEYEHVDLAKLGFVAGYTAVYRPSDESHTAWIEFAMFDDASGATSSIEEMLPDAGGAPSTFEVAEGDESHGLTIPGLTYVLLRQDQVVALIGIFYPNGEDRREGMRLLARDVAGSIEDMLAQSGS